MSALRLFAALSLPDDLRSELALLQDGGVPGANWVEPEMFHITLAFYGEVDGAVAHDIDVELSAIRHPALPLALGGADIFGGKKPHAMFAKVTPNDSLDLLAAKCVTAGRRAGVTHSDGKYKPHVTLARLRQADPARVMNWVSRNSLFRSRVFEAATFTLFSSHPRHGGHHYVAEREYGLEGPAPSH